MNTPNEETKANAAALTPIDCANLFEEHLTGKDVKKIRDEIGCSVSTVYQYLREGIPNNPISKNTAERIVECGKRILLEKSIAITTALND